MPAGYSKQHYQNDKARYYERNERQRLRLKQILIEAKAKPCRDCGVQYPSHVMDFDHLDDSEKLDDVSRFTRFTKKKLLTEIAKCDVVYSNLTESALTKEDNVNRKRVENRSSTLFFLSPSLLSPCPFYSGGRALAMILSMEAETVGPESFA
jgi:hypothetical protein